MPKRFTDTDKWKKPFIRSLPTPYKLLWFYILDDCNHAGIWEVDIEVAEIRTGEKFTEKLAIEIFGDRVQKIADSKWFLPDFISFQYGELNEKNRVHFSIIQILNKYKIKPLTSPLQGVKDKEQDKDKEKEKEIVLQANGKKFKFDEVGELSDVQIGSAYQLIKITQKTDLSTEDIQGLWLVFKRQHLTGKKYYESVEDIYSHFLNSLQTKKLNGTHQQVNTVGRTIEFDKP